MRPLALTFDDGPDGSATPRLLALLADAGARATFFVIAPRAAARPDLVARMIDGGHEVALHCCEHVRHSDRDAAWVAADTERGLAILGSLGVGPCRWRTPWGDRAPGTDVIAAAHGLALVGWTVDTHDWRGDSAHAMFAATRDALVPGAVVLAHDGLGPGARRGDATETIRYTRLVLDHAARSGLRVGALG